MQEAISRYIKNPKQKNSIMPKPFFFKFPMKGKIYLEDKILRQSINAYLERFNIRKKMRLLSTH